MSFSTRSLCTFALAALPASELGRFRQTRTGEVAIADRRLGPRHVRNLARIDIRPLN